MGKKLWMKEAFNCGRKRIYKTKAEAENQVRARFYNAGQTAHTYKCDKCSHYHTTSKSTGRLTASSKVWDNLAQNKVNGVTNNH